MRTGCWDMTIKGAFFSYVIEIIGRIEILRQFAQNMTKKRVFLAYNVETKGKTKIAHRDAKDF